MPPGTLLLVGGREADRSAICEALCDCCVLVADDAAEALLLMQARDDLDVVVLDLDTPETDALELLRSLGNGCERLPFSIIALTDGTDPLREAEALRAGAVDYLRRPLHPEAVRARISIHQQLQLQKRRSRQVQNNMAVCSALFRQAPVGICVAYSPHPSDPDEEVATSINPMFETVTGRSREELIRLGWAAITHPEDFAAEMPYFARLRAGEISGYSLEKRFIRPDGSAVWADIVVAPFTTAGGHHHTYICVIEDISQRKAMEQALMESERSKSVLLSHLPGMAYRCANDAEWTMHYVSSGCEALTGHPAESLLYNRDLSFNDLIAPEYHQVLRDEWIRILPRHEPFRWEYEIITKDGERKWVLEMGQGVYDDDDTVVALEGIVLDVSERVAVEQERRYASEHDALTGLPNLKHLEASLAHDSWLRLLDRRALVGVSLRAAKLVEVVYGFQYGNELTRRVASALEHHVNDRHLLFHTHEDRFVFYVTDHTCKDELVTFAEAVASTLEEVLTVERSGISIGVVELENEMAGGFDAAMTHLLLAAERSMEVLESTVGIAFYDDRMETDMLREQAIRQELVAIGAASDAGALVVQYQPVLDVASQCICGFEALARIHSATLGPVSPLEFVPIAEKTRLIVPVGRQIARQAFGFLRRMRESGHPGVGLSLNISVLQLLSNGFVEELLGMIAEEGVDPSAVCIEITESVFGAGGIEINAVLDRVRGLGVRVALDDFGTGYSSFARERDLSIDYLKIDRDFIDRLLVLSPEEAVTRDIISMAHRLGHCVVAEGVEYETQRRYLEECGCDMIQGYLISPALGEDEAIAFLDGWRATHDDCCAQGAWLRHG